MIRNRRFSFFVVTAALALGACGGPSAGTSSDSPAGDPVAGGSARIVQINEPRSLDPAIMGNAWVLDAVLGNALYGTLMINDPATGKVAYKMAESFTTSDGGSTFELKLRPGLTFSDGSPLDAGAVKVNWDRIADPATESSNIVEASMVASTTVVDATTLKITMVTPAPHYAQAVLSTSMNWIASPKALKAGRQAFDAKPVGAGPYTLKKWTRQDTIELVKNPDYWDAPKPYLDALTLRTSNDTGQRINTLTSGGADVAVETNWGNLAKAKTAGFPAETVPASAGVNFTMNTRRPPFDDARARRAVAAALDLDAINQTVYLGNGTTARTLFSQSSPFHSDLELTKTDRSTAQKLFNELAAEGKPVSFTFKSGAQTENRAMAESVQAQLSAFDNVDVKVQVLDLVGILALRRSYDFDMTISAATFVDPEPQLWNAFHGDSPGNTSGIDDEKLNAALKTGRTATTPEERTAAYQVVQERLAELTPAIFVIRAAPSAITGKNVQGIVQYGNGSLLPEELWMRK